jgi:formimidoylglutamate deiminase
MPSETHRFFTPLAWVQGTWARDVLLTVQPDGLWGNIQPRAMPEHRLGATVLDGPVLPGLVNAHSHAFQRAIAGLTENRPQGGRPGVEDNFWSWRDRMYSAANRITPEQLEAIAAFLYAELLAGGYTQVCEFHYLHHQPSGQPYAQPLELALALTRAAQRVGMGLTLLPTLYMRSGFGAAGLREDQRRFGSTPQGIWAMVEGLQRQLPARGRVGVAVHSLRAAGKGAIKELTDQAARAGVPVHIHIAEQTQEVDDCITHTGQRPIEWLLNHLPVDSRWNLVHATHASASELLALRHSGAAAVICPSTEANLGDGVFDLAAHLGGAGPAGRWSIGSDSHVGRAWTEELRLLEYSQRLTQRRRNVASQLLASASTAGVLFEGALAGGSGAAGLPLGGLRVGQRADFVVLEAHAPALLAVPDEHLLDALVFSSPAQPFRQVYVAGSPVLGEGASWRWQDLGRDFAQAMRELWAP